MVSAVEGKCNYFIGGKHHHRKIKLLSIMLPKASVLQSKENVIILLVTNIIIVKLNYYA